MTSLKSVIPNSVSVVCGTMSNENDLDKIQRILKNNEKLYKQSKKSIFVFNKKDEVSDVEFEKLFNFIKDYFSNSVILVDHINRNYQIAFIDQDWTWFNYLKYNNIEYDFIIKHNIDILLYDEFFNLNFDETCDLFFTPELTCLDKNVYELDKRNIHKQKTYDPNLNTAEFNGSWPQPWLYIISKNVKKIYSCGENELRQFHAKWILETGGDLNNWHHQNKLLCSEEFLVKSFCNVNLKKQCLMDKDDFDKYCDFIVNYKVGDATIKNIYMVKYGICHWHWKNNDVFYLKF
jgi:hypothetical protein